MTKTLRRELRSGQKRKTPVIKTKNTCNKKRTHESLSGQTSSKKEERLL